MPNQDLEVLVTEFRADIKRYEAALRKQVRASDKAARDSEKRWAKMNRRMQGLLGGSFQGMLRDAGRFAAAFGATLSVRALDRLAADSIRAGDEIGKAAKVADIGAETLQEYQFAAGQAGVRQQELTDALGRFTRRRGEAIRGNKEYARAFEQLGVSIEDTNEQALAKAFRRLGEVENVTVRTSLATKVFGDDARRMALLVRDGADGLAELRAEAREAGAVLSNETVAAMEAAQDRLTKLEVQLGVKLQQATAENIEAFIAWRTTLNDALVTLVEVAGGVDDLIRSWKRFAGLRASNDVRDLRIQYADLGLEIDKVRERAEKRFKLPNVKVLGSIGQVRIISDEERIAALEAQRANILAEIEQKEAAIAARKKEQEETARRMAGGSGGAAGVTIITDREAEEAKRLIAEIDAAHNKTFESEIARIERERDARLAALETAALSREEKAREGARVEAIANEEIAQLKREHTEAEIELLESVVDARDQALGRTLDIAQREYDARKALIEAEIADETRRMEALTALEEGFSAFKAKLAQEDREREEQQREFRNRSIAATLAITSDTFAELAGVARDYAGEQSAIFKSLFAASKAFAVAESIVKIQAALANALVAPFPQNLFQYAQVASLGAGIVSTVTATNYRHGGRVAGPGTGNSDSIPARLSDGEFVVNAEATRRNLAALEAINSGRSFDGFAARFQAGGLAGQSFAAPQINVAAPAAPAAGPSTMQLAPEVAVKVVNLFDARAAMAEFANSREGEEAYLNVVSRNKSGVNAILGR